MLAVPNMAYAAGADVAIDPGGISFSTSTFYVGDTIRVYARIRNLGDEDVTAEVYFYHTSEMIGRGQPISMRADGAPEEVFVDFVVPDGEFNIRAVVRGDDVVDNNEAVTALYTPIADDDRDGVANGDDNCADDANANQRDVDDDGVGDACDVRDNRPVAAHQDDEPTEEEVPQPTSPTKVAVAPSSSGTTAVGASSNVASTGEAETAEQEAQVPRPTSSYGIFPEVQAATGEEVDATPSFFRMDNPWLIALLIMLGCGVVGAAGWVVYMRLRVHPESGNEDV